MATSKKKVKETTPVVSSVAKIEPVGRVIPEIPNTFHFYVYNQYLIRMESLDKNLKIDADLIKYVLSLIKEKNVLGVHLFTLVLNEDTGKILLNEVTKLEEEALDLDLQKVINKIFEPSNEKTDGVVD